MKLTREFYREEDVVSVAKKLIGKVLFAKSGKTICAGIISETEAYNGIYDRASHAYGGRRTARTEIMYREGGYSYIYLCYGIHSLFNVVTGRKDVPQAVLIRAVLPLLGIAEMERRRKRKFPAKGFSSGPGSVCQALGLHYRQSGTSLSGNVIWLEDRGIAADERHLQITKRIGVEYAGKDAHLPYRFRMDEVHFG